MQQVQMYYPVQGTNKFGTTSFPLTKTFRLDVSAHSADKTSTTHTFKKGSIILGWVAKVTTACASTASGELQLGFTGEAMLSAATAVTSIDAIADVMGPSATAAVFGKAYVLTADDTFDAINTTGAFTAGALDVHVTYIPPQDGVAPSTFKGYTIT